MLGLSAGWLALALLYALLAQPADTLAVLNVRGTRGVPAVVWAGTRDLVRLVGGGPAADTPHDR